MSSAIYNAHKYRSIIYFIIVQPQHKNVLIEKYAQKAKHSFQQ